MSNPRPAAAAATDEHLPMPLWELVALLVAMTALVALSIDMMLPALDDVARDLELARPNDQQYVVLVYLAGFGASQIIYGPLADRFGRKPVMLIAIALYLVMTLICALTPTFELLLVARFLQGAAAAASRVITVAVARDLTSGRRMAEVMSMVMTAFMAVPVLAPSLGQLILTFAPWRWIFGFLILFGVALMVWIQLRLPETLKPEYRTPLALKTTWNAFREAMTHRLMLGYTLAGTTFFGALYGFLGSSQQIFVEHFGLNDNQFPLAFAAIAGGMGVTSYINSRLVMRFGQRRLAHGALLVFTAISCVHVGAIALGVDNLWAFLILLAAAMSLLGLIAANFSSLAMEPMGHIAGTASAAYGFVTGVIGAAIGTFIGQAYDGSALPLMAGQALMGLATVAIVVWTEKGRLMQTGANSE
ncbi:multidrug effflux MFS transporter [Maricaulis sp. D1M11]|uniref:multidrug effflux MFS transporter n=1 Tax=Maricaulis sp. D1M11 TaxID=3076117 RepID=UPI0039B3EC21